MKVELKVNLKIDGMIVNAGRKYDDEIEKFPEFVVSNLENPKVIKVLIPAKVKEVEETKEEVEVKGEVEETKEDLEVKPKLNKKNKE